MSKRLNRKTLQIRLLVTAFLLLSIIQILYLQLRIENLKKDVLPEKGNNRHLNAVLETSANAVATTLMCINYPPTNITYECNQSIPWGYSYECTLGVTDYLNSSGFYSYTSAFLTTPELFNVTSEGEISFIPEKSAIGNHTFRVYVYDDSGCENNMFYKDFTITIINSSHPPVLIANFTNQSIFIGNAYSFFLNNYFMDPDGGRLEYIASYNGAYVSVSIANNSFTTVRGVGCGESPAYFVATDTDNETATSNTVKYSVYGCAQSVPSSGGVGGGGGGGGGGRISNCDSDWRCGKWGKCLPNGTQVLECRDYNGCDSNNYLEHFYRNCTYVPAVYVCPEQWICSNWTECINDTRTRVCFDNSSCGTNNSKPSEIENCFLEDSCANGIQDNDESGIDCGGNCKPCPEIQSPAQIVKSNMGLIIAALLTAFVIAGISYLLRHKIRKVYVLLVSKKKKKIYLNKEQKERLVKTIYVMQERVEKSCRTIIPMIRQFSIDYFKEIFGLENPTREDIVKNLPKLRNKTLENNMLRFYDALAKSYTITTDNAALNSLVVNNPVINLAASRLSKEKIQALLDEMLYNVFLLSEFSDKDAIICPKVRVVTEKATLSGQSYAAISNIMLAMIFEEFSEAEKQYKALLESYSKSQFDEKKILYDDILRVYEYIIGSSKILNTK